MPPAAGPLIPMTGVAPAVIPDLGAAASVVVTAAGGSAAVGYAREVHHHPPARSVAWPLRVGAVPVLASAFQARPELRTRPVAGGKGWC